MTILRPNRCMDEASQTTGIEPTCIPLICPWKVSPFLGTVCCGFFIFLRKTRLQHLLLPCFICSEVPDSNGNKLLSRDLDGFTLISRSRESPAAIRAPKICGNRSVAGRACGLWPSDVFKHVKNATFRFAQDCAFRRQQTVFSQCRRAFLQTVRIPIDPKIWI